MNAMYGVGVNVNATYTASATANSKNPHDWGRAMAAALSDLVEQSEGDAASPDELYGENLHLVIEETESGVQIQLSWSPGGQDADAGGAGG
ncbi:hypothetical protein [Arthrobacter sulfonylureivorans]|uniref:Uncharacterized protein n=1 Tax=Arthrobacter sulfonylureivorans TaxID=2486855 RepID=A0ABY3W7Y0_9MICC|nr:hypothetical protein [Arthrobacter sulfonylureivorans]UNK46437.1 hypothetical protein MNQ99_03445 [Arthrobacter sulfonylureivorans]